MWFYNVSRKKKYLSANVDCTASQYMDGIFRSNSLMLILFPVLTLFETIIATGVRGIISRDSFIRRLTPTKLHNYARLCEKIATVDYPANEEQLQAFFSLGLLKDYHKIISVWPRNAFDLHAFLIQKDRNKYLLVFKDGDSILDSAVLVKAFMNIDWGMDAIQEKNAKFMHKVCQRVMETANPNLPLLFECVGSGLAGTFAHNAAWLIKFEYPKLLNIDPELICFNVITFNPLPYWDNFVICAEKEKQLGSSNILNIHRKHHVFTAKLSPGIDFYFYPNINRRKDEDDLSYLTRALLYFDDEDLREFATLYFLKDDQRRHSLSWTSRSKTYALCKGSKWLESNNKLKSKVLSKTKSLPSTSIKQEMSEALSKQYSITYPDLHQIDADLSFEYESFEEKEEKIEEEDPLSFVYEGPEANDDGEAELTGKNEEVEAEVKLSFETSEEQTSENESFSGCFPSLSVIHQDLPRENVKSTSMSSPFDFFFAKAK